MNDVKRYLQVQPARGPPDVVLVASASKSATHRAILLGSLTPHTVVDNALVSNDTVASLRVAGTLGARVSAEPVTDAGRRLLERVGSGVERLSGPGADAVPPEWDGVVLNDVLAATSPSVPRPLLAASVRLHIERDGTPTQEGVALVDCANSGTTLRIATALAAVTGRTFMLTGDASLRSRPMAPLVDALRALGVEAACDGADGRPPVTVKGPVRPGRAEIRGDVSSQYISALLVAAQAAPGPVEVAVTTPLKSAPYVDVTLAMVRSFGGAVEVEEPADAAKGPVYRMPGAARLAPVCFRVPGDFSSAAYPLVAAAILGGRVTLAGLDADSEQGDRAILDVLAAAGCGVKWADDREHGGKLVTVTAPSGPLRAFRHSFRNTPDLFPPLAVLAARASGTSHLVDASHVRLKECDRVAAMASGLRDLGFSLDERPDALDVTGRPGAPVESARIESHDDHRILMSFSILGLVGPGPLYITDPGCYHVSYPRFRMDLDSLGGETRVVEEEAVHAAVPQRQASP